MREKKDPLVRRAVEICLFLFLGASAGLRAQEPAEALPEWQAEVRKYTQARDWPAALHIVDREIARSPQDTDIRAWRARILTWSGRLSEAEQEYLSIIRVVPNDPDTWMGLGTVYLRQGRTQEALGALDRAVELDPGRADLHAAYGRALRAAQERKESRLEFQRALSLDPTSAEARAGLRSLQGAGKHELRFGHDSDLLSYTNPYHDEWMGLVSRWNGQWSTSFAGGFFQRGGTDAGRFSASLTRAVRRLGAVTIGGATGHDSGVIPRTEAFFDLDRGWKISETQPLRGLELTYGQHWYWYASARILTINWSGIMYLPGECTWSLGLTGARSTFSGEAAHWEPSGITRLEFPLARRSYRSLFGNVFFAVGTEDFARVDQIGHFASHTYGGGLRLQFTARQDISGVASYQKRSQGRTDTNFGLTYGIRF